MFQSAAVNVRLETETVPSAVLLEDTGIVTSAVGWLVSTTLNEAWPPASVAVPENAGTEMPAASLSADRKGVVEGKRVGEVGGARAGAARMRGRGMCAG